MSSVKDDWEEYSVIGDKGEIGFIDFADDESVCNYDLEMDGPVIISSPFPFQRRKPRSILAGAISKCPVTIENTTAEPVELWGVKIYCSVPADSFTLSLMEPPSIVNSKDEKHGGFLEGYFLEDRVLQPHEKLTIWLSCKPKELGLHTSVVHFDVGNERIERVAFLLADDDISQSLASSRPYSRAPRLKQFVVNDYIVSSRPAVGPSNGPSNGGYKNKLPQFPIPENVRLFLESKQIPDVLKEGLKKDNYDLFFSTLLIMEELNLEKEMRLHTMEGVCMKKRGAQLLALEVPGLAEKRPSLVNGDHVFAKVAFDNSPGNTVYQGFTFRVEADEVLLRFAKEFHDNYRTGNLYDVRFTYNRVNMRRLYQAVEMAERIDRDIIFPSHSAAKRLVDGAGFAPFASSLNEEQRHSVAMILGCKGGPPYMIYGPPGTGKTVTLVEAMLQLYATWKNARVLICAASNSAADHILEKLVTNEHVHVKDSELFRLNATSRSYDDVQPAHVPYCYFEESIFKCPPLKALSKYRIIISTYMSVSLLHAEGINRGHFSHLFLDECGQASEPECMIPIANLCKRGTVVVLAGDPQQLGPVVYCKDAEAFGLGKSFLERLFECEFYSNEDKNYVTKLVRNYRCHPAILDLPSKLFYKGELLGCKEDTSPIVCSSVNFITNKDFPVVFIGIQGCDEREGNNPSWFNRIEASKVVEVIRKLTASQDVNEKDIGVITPYRQQVLKIKKALESWDMSDIRVGSVEQFQGQEREVIIVSTVRSTVKHNDFDRTHCLGFLSNPKRFNVAITRARSLLIIVGNPHIVCKDQYWNKLLWYCVDNNSYHGCALPERQSTGLEEPAPSEKV